MSFVRQRCCKDERVFKPCCPKKEEIDPALLFLLLQFLNRSPTAPDASPSVTVTSGTVNNVGGTLTGVNFPLSLVPTPVGGLATLLATGLATTTIGTLTGIPPTATGSLNLVSADFGLSGTGTTTIPYPFLFNITSGGAVQLSVLPVASPLAAATILDQLVAVGIVSLSGGVYSFAPGAYVRLNLSF